MCVPYVLFCSSSTPAMDKAPATASISLIGFHARLRCTNVPPMTPYFIRTGDPMLPTEHSAVCRPHRTEKFLTFLPSAKRFLYTVLRQSSCRDCSLSCISSVLQIAKQAWLSISLGAFHTARMASPMYSMSVPLLPITTVGKQ